MGLNYCDLLNQYQELAEELIIYHTEKAIVNFNNPTNNACMISSVDDIRKRLTSISSEPGLYFFEINIREFLNTFIHEIFSGDQTSWVVECYDFFQQAWINEQGRGVSNYAKVVKSRLLYHLKKIQENGDFEKEGDIWIPLYIGKRTEVAKRVGEHFYNHSKTYSMKLGQLLNTPLGKSGVRISVYLTPELKHEPMYSILGIVEKAIRAEMIPVVGR